MLLQLPSNTDVTVMQLDWKASPDEAIKDFIQILQYHNEANKAVEVNMGDDQFYLCIFPSDTNYTTEQLKAIINNDDIEIFKPN